jgi:hypothetical protein
MKFKVFILLSVILLGASQVLGQDKIFSRPDYSLSSVISRWGTYSFVADSSLTDLRQAAYTAVAGGLKVRGWMHKDFVWDGNSGPSTARFDFALCAEVALGLSFSYVDIKVKGYVRDVTTTKYPVFTTLYHYSRSSAGYDVFIQGGLANRGIEMVKGHSYTIGYVVDVSATCYPRSYCPMAHVNMGEQGCSFWWQPTGIFGG